VKRQVTNNDWIGLDWIGLDWIGLDWIGLDWIGLDWIGLDWIGLDWIGLDWIDDWIGLVWTATLVTLKQEAEECRCVRSIIHIVASLLSHLSISA